jgi:GDP-4-dehydro-6-deoxy-D-mannose reductase
VRYLVTGASGFIGWHVVSSLLEKNEAVTAWVRSKPLWQGQAATEAIDITDRAAVAASLKAADPDVVLHLAAQSFPVHSWSNPIETIRVNTEGTLNLLQAVRDVGRRSARVLLCGSSAQYAPNAGPVAEDAPIGPTSPYAVSKLASDYMGKIYSKAFDLDVVRFRPFAWIGTRKKDDVASDLARKIVAIEGGAAALVSVGSTDAIRDIIDVRDGVAALMLLVERGVKGSAYNICRGEGTSVAGLIEEFRRQARGAFEVVVDPKLVRPVDDPVKIGDPSRMFDLGWRPRYSLSQSVGDILNYWRAAAGTLA